MTKISQLTDIGTGLAPNDEFIIRDVSDASTPNKKVTASGFFVVASALGLTGLDRITNGTVASGTQTRVYASGISGYSETTVVGIPSARTTISGYFENASGTVSGVFFPVVTQTDIGSDANQISLNGMLGSMAFEDADFVNAGLISVSSGVIVPSGAAITVQSGGSVLIGSGASITPSGNFVVINGSGITVASGTAATPAISPIGDSNTGIFFPSGDTIAFAEGGVEALRLTPTGQLRLATAGITFNGDTATANELDDYEEGTWTPTWGSQINPPTGANGVTAISGSTKYVKIGSLVHVATQITLNNASGNFVAGTTVEIGGLPFSAVFPSNRQGPVTGFSSNGADTALFIGHVTTGAIRFGVAFAGGTGAGSVITLAANYNVLQ